MTDAHHLDRMSLCNHQIRQKKQYDLHTLQTKYLIGDAVYLTNSATKVGSCKKVQSIWLGPYMVKAILSPVLIQIESQKRIWVVHCDRLKPCATSSLPLWLWRKRKFLLEALEWEPEAEDITRLEDDPESQDNARPDELVYCICRKPDDGEIMVACEGCEE